MSVNRNSCGKSNNNSESNNNFSTDKSCFFSLSPQQFSLLASLLGIVLTNSLDIDEQNSLGNFFVSVGQGLLTAAAQGQVLQDDEPQNQRIHQQIRMLKEQIRLLEKEVTGQ